MKKSIIFLSVMFLVFGASISFAEVITFPSVQMTVDIEPGCSYKDDGEGNVGIVTPEGSVLTIGKFDAKEMNTEQWAIELSKIHNGSIPTQSGGAYRYVFNDDRTTVILSIDEDTNKCIVVSMTANSEADMTLMQEMLNSAEEY